MNQIIQNILTRRSIRDFSDKLVSKSDIELLLKTATYAPCGMGKQTFQFFALLNQSKIKELANLIEKTLGRTGYNFYNATALIITTNEIESLWKKEDNACSMQNIALASHSMGIGSVWINQLSDICDNAEIRCFLDSINVPSSHEVLGITALGYSLSEPRGEIPKKAICSIIE